MTAGAFVATLPAQITAPGRAAPAGRRQPALTFAAATPLATVAARGGAAVTPPPLRGAPTVADDERFPVAPAFSPAAQGATPPDAPQRSPTNTLPLVPRPLARASTVESLPFLLRREKAVDVREIQEKVSRRVEESLHRRVHEDVTQVIARELAPNSPIARRLGDRIYSDLYESLVIEKERLGWG
jgi:hypothetical protein